MSIAKIKLDEGTSLDFGCTITGASGIPQARFIIERDEGFSVSFPCTLVNESLTVNIHSLDKLFKAGEYKSRLEVVIENKLYTPMEETIEFEPAVAINMSPKVQTVVKESVKVNGIKVKALNEDILRKTQAATLIAKSLNYIPEGNETPEQIIKHALSSDQNMTKDQLKTLQEMLTLAEEVGVKID